MKIALAVYLGYFLKMGTSENRTTEIRSNQEPSVIGIIITLLEGSEDPICLP